MKFFRGVDIIKIQNVIDAETFQSQNHLSAKPMKRGRLCKERRKRKQASSRVKKVKQQYPARARVERAEEATEATEKDSPKQGLSVESQARCAQASSYPQNLG